MVAILLGMAQPAAAWIQRFPDVAVDAAGDVFVGGEIVTGATPNFMLVSKLAGTTGEEIWRTVFDPAPSPNGHADAITVDSSGDVVVAGDYGSSAPHALAVAKLDGATGAELWTYSVEGLPGSSDGANVVAPDPSGDVFAAGRLFDKDRPFIFLSVKADQADGSTGGLRGQTMVFRDKDPGDPTKRRLKFLVKGDEVQTTLPGSLNEPMLVGATIRLWNPSTLEEAILAAPPGPDWKGIGNPPGINGYVYKDKTSVNPCRLSIRPFKNLKVACRAMNGPIPLSLDEASQGSLIASVALGSAGPRCAIYGGLVVRDEPG